ncbi:MAG: RNA-binding protein, partial [Cyanobium sp.]
MSIRLYVGNLPQSFEARELEALFEAVGTGVRFKAVLDR